MTIFTVKGQEIDFHNCVKDYKQASIPVKRIYEDGTSDFLHTQFDEKFLLDNPDMELLSKHLNLYNRGTGERRSAEQLHIVLDNKEYQEAIVPWYGEGASNTKEKHVVRLTFRLDESVCVIRLTHNSRGGYSFRSILDDVLDDFSFTDYIEDYTLEENGITYDSKADELHFLLLDEALNTDTIHLSVREFLDHLVKAEVIEYEMTILEPGQE